MNILGWGEPDIRKLEKEGKKWDLANIIIDHWGHRELVKKATRALRRLGNPAIDALADALIRLKKKEEPLPLTEMDIRTGLEIREYILDFARRADPSKLSPHARKTFDEAKRWMFALADHKDPKVRIMAVLTLGKMADRDAKPVILRLLGDRDGMVRAMAAESLSYYLDEKLVEPLVVALSDKNADVRWGAVYSLGKIGGRQVMGQLIGALEDKDQDVRVIAAGSLGELKDSAAIEVLKAHLTDRSLQVRKASAEALGRIDRKEAFKSVRAAYKYEVIPPPFRESRDILLIFLDIDVLNIYFYQAKLIRRLKKHFEIVEESYAVWSELMRDEISYADITVTFTAASRDGKTCPVMLLLEDAPGELVVDVRNFRKMEDSCQKMLIALLVKTMDEYLISPNFG